MIEELLVCHTCVDVLQVAGVDVLAVHRELGPLREGERRPLLLIPVADAADFQGLHQRKGGSTLFHTISLGNILVAILRNERQDFMLNIFDSTVTFGFTDSVNALLPVWT